MNCILKDFDHYWLPNISLLPLKVGGDSMMVCSRQTNRVRLPSFFLLLKTQLKCKHLIHFPLFLKRLGVCLHAHRMSVHVHTSPMVSSQAQPKNKEPLFYFYFFLLVPKTSLDQLVFYAFAKNYTFLRPQETFSNQRLFTFFGQQR